VPSSYRYSIAFIGWMGLVTFFSLYSFRDPDPSRSETLHLDKIVHFTFYFVACILGVCFLRERLKTRLSLINSIILIVVFTIVYGVIIEVLQHMYTLTRQGDVYDVVANSLGSLFGAFLAYRLFNKSGRYSW
jgi:VanZ family protein